MPPTNSHWEEARTHNLYGSPHGSHRASPARPGGVGRAGLCLYLPAKTPGQRMHAPSIRMTLHLWTSRR